MSDSKKSSVNSLLVYDGGTGQVTFQITLFVDILPLKYSGGLNVHVSLDDQLTGEDWKSAIWHNITDEITWHGADKLVWSSPMTLIARRIMLTSKEKFDGTVGRTTVKSADGELMMYI